MPVRAISILQEQLNGSHDVIEQAVADLTPEQLHYRGDGSTIQSIAVIYAHTVMSEDWLVNTNLRQQASVFERDGFSGRVGIGMVPFGDDSDDWIASLLNVNVDALREYAARVYAETNDYLATLSEDDLDTMLNFYEEMSTGVFLGNAVGWHAAHHGGEICALKGVLGQQGLPY